MNEEFDHIRTFLGKFHGFVLGFFESAGQSRAEEVGMMSEKSFMNNERLLISSNEDGSESSTACATKVSSFIHIMQRYDQGSLTRFEVDDEETLAPLLVLVAGLERLPW